MDHKQKYLKYKQKYLYLKNLIGGNPSIDLITQAIAILVTIPDVGTSNTLRKLIYDIIQAQHYDEQSPIYIELNCAIHLGLIGEEGGSIITLLCGHSFCKDCISGVFTTASPKCPTCRKVITRRLEEFGNTNELYNIIRRLLPLDASSSSLSRPSTQMSTWNCSNCNYKNPAHLSICSYCSNQKETATTSTSTTSHNPELTAILQRLDQALVLLRQALQLIQTAKTDRVNIGANPSFREALYNLIKCQRSDKNDCAIYKELRCQLPLAEGDSYHLCGTNGDAITLLCGHSYCKECIRPYNGGACPCITSPVGAPVTQCSARINIDSILKTVAISNLVNSLNGPITMPSPMPAPNPGGGP